MRLCLACCAAMLTLSAPGRADPVILVPDAGQRAERDSDRLGRPSDFWFFGDGGFGCPLAWCDGPDAQHRARVGAAPHRPQQPDLSDFWFFGDGGLDCPEWQCGGHGPAAESE